MKNYHNLANEKPLYLELTVYSMDFLFITSHSSIIESSPLLCSLDLPELKCPELQFSAILNKPIFAGKKNPVSFILKVDITHDNMD